MKCVLNKDVLHMHGSLKKESVTSTSLYLKQQVQHTCTAVRSLDGYTIKESLNFRISMTTPISVHLNLFIFDQLVVQYIIALYKCIIGIRYAINLEVDIKTMLT